MLKEPTTSSELFWKFQYTALVSPLFGVCGFLQVNRALSAMFKPLTPQWKVTVSLAGSATKLTCIQPSNPGPQMCTYSLEVFGPRLCCIPQPMRLINWQLTSFRALQLNVPSTWLRRLCTNEKAAYGHVRFGPHPFLMDLFFDRSSGLPLWCRSSRNPRCGRTGLTAKPFPAKSQRAGIMASP